MSILNIKNLNISAQKKTLLRGGDFLVKKSEIVGLFGVSGSGKSVFSLFLMGFLKQKNSFVASSDSAQYFYPDFHFNLFSNSLSSWCRFRSSEVSMVFQDPSTSLNPTIKCGEQIKEAFIKNSSHKSSSFKSFSYKLLSEVGIGCPEKIIKSFPCEISGGEKQRVVIAIALASNPRLLIADEPTTSLDPITQRDVLNLLVSIKKTRNISVVLISHNLDLLKFYSDRFYIFHDFSFFSSCSKTGSSYIKKKELLLKKIKINTYLESGPGGVKTIINRIKNNYDMSDFILDLKNVSVVFKKNKTPFFAIKNISFSFKGPDVLGVVGGSGSGKTSLGRVLCGIENSFLGYYNQKNSVFLKSCVQMVYQDPFSSFNPKIKTGDSIKEIIELFKSNFSVQELFSLVGLNHNYINKYPHELSGGEKQRLSIARVIASKPKLIIFDESLSGLDLDIQFSILNLIRFINKFLRVGIVFISHDISSVSYLCKRILVLKNGGIIDLFDSKNLNSKNRKPYTKKLIQAANFKKNE